MDRLRSCLPHSAKTSTKSSPPTASTRFRVGDRVVYIHHDNDGRSDDQRGWLMWIGHLTHIDRTLTMQLAGIEFVRFVPIQLELFQDYEFGAGTGYFHGCQIFCAKMNHACFVPIEALALEHEYDNDLLNNSAPYGRVQCNASLCAHLQPPTAEGRQIDEAATAATIVTRLRSVHAASAQILRRQSVPVVHERRRGTTRRRSTTDDGGAG